jgi:DNA replication protein DnaC
MTAEEIDAALAAESPCPTHDVVLTGADRSFCERCFEIEQREQQRRIDASMQTETLVAAIRRRHGCKQASSGEWLCSCGAALEKDAVGPCNACTAKRAREHRERLRAASTSRAPRYVRDALARLPLWSHARVGTAEFKATCRSTRLRNFAEKYTLERGSAALMTSSGLGKTTATVALVHRLIAEGVAAGMDIGPEDGRRQLDPAELKPTRALWQASKIVWTTAVELVRARRIHALGEGEPKLIEEAREASLLVMDELGSEPFDRDGELFALVDERYRVGAPTIVTTGLPEKEGEKGFVGRYGEAFLRRLIERGTKIEEFRAAPDGEGRG